MSAPAEKPGVLRVVTWRPDGAQATITVRWEGDRICSASCSCGRFLTTGPLSEEHAVGHAQARHGAVVAWETAEPAVTPPSRRQRLAAAWRALVEAARP